MNYLEKILYTLWKIFADFITSSLPLLFIVILISIVTLLIFGFDNAKLIAGLLWVFLKLPYFVVLWVMAGIVLSKKIKDPRNPFSFLELISQSFLFNIDSVFKLFSPHDPFNKMNKLKY